METMDIHEIFNNLPHRYPFLLVDRVTSYTVGEQLIAIKNVTINEPFFQGHFPIRPVMPGVLVVEAMAQATGLLSFKTAQVQPDSKSLYYLAGIDKVRFKRPVEPGDQLILTVDLISNKRGLWKYKAKTEVDGHIVAVADLMCVNRDIET